YRQTNQKTDTGKTLTRWPVFVDHFSYGEDGITWLRDSLAKLDTSGCTSELPISAGNSVGLFMVVGGC
ncbi:hypothetical protein PO590_27210, partial [Raoultella ornithinolytica]